MTTPATGTTPSATPNSAAVTPPSQSSGSSSSGTSPIGTFALEILGVVILAIIAGIGPRVGKIVVLFMVGILILWLVLNASTLKQLIPGSNVSVQG